jgi:hypothetical protein
MIAPVSRNSLSALLLGCVALVGTALVTTDAVAAPLVANGDFDNIGNVWTNNTGLGSNDFLTLGGVSIPDWTNVPGAANEFWVTVPNSYSGLTASPGNGSAYFVDLTGQSNSLPFGGLEQAIATAIGKTYNLTFDLGAATTWNTGPLAGSALTASATGSALLASQLFSLIPTGTNDWETETLSFTADSTSTTIEFLADSSQVNSRYIGLDNVAVVAASTPVPEPFTLSLFGAGLAGAAALRRRKKAKA